MKWLPVPLFRSDFRAMLKQQFLLLTRYPLNLTANFLLVLLMVIVVTIIVTIFAPEESETRLSGITLSGFIIYIFLTHTIWTVGLSIHKEQTEGTLTSFYLTPGSRFFSLLARSLVVVSWTGAAGVVGLLLAHVVTGPRVIYQPGLALGILFFTISTLVGLGFALAGLALRFGETIELVANVLEFGLIGLCALFFPFSVLPPLLQTVAKLIPLSYAVDALRTVALGAPQPELLTLPVELAIVAATGLLSPLLGYTIYRFNESVVRQQGKL